jgi:antitoxin component YwqK of YwqJK toxin-antitoxin module
MRLLFSSLGLLILLSHFVSCEKVIKECPNIKYDGNITELNGVPFSGSCYTYYSSGELNSIQSYKKGKDHGEWIFYYQNENIETKGTFEMGKRIGVWEYFYKNGKVYKRNIYDNSGKPKGNWVTYDNSGNLINTFTY